MRNFSTFSYRDSKGSGFQTDAFVMARGTQALQQAARPIWSGGFIFFIAPVPRKEILLSILYLASPEPSVDASSHHKGTI